MNEPYSFGMLINLPAIPYRAQMQAVLSSDGIKVAGANTVWRYYCVTLTQPRRVFKVYTDDFTIVEPASCMLPEYVGQLRQEAY